MPSTLDGKATAPRGVVSYRVSLVVAIPLFVILTGAIVASNTYLSARGSIRKLGDTLFDQVADQTAQQVHAHLREAPPAVDTLTVLLANDPAVSARPTDELARRLLAVLRANSGFAWVSFSAVDGSFTGVQRTVDGALVVNQTRIENGRTVRDEHTVAPDGTWVLSRHDPDADYDPRTRPWYLKAVAAKKRIFTEPYVFFDQGVPGMTCGAPVYDAAGELRGVVTADFSLNSFGDFVATLHPSPGARVFIYSDSGAILAHSSLRVVEKVGSRDQGSLITKDDVSDGPMRQHFRSPAARSFDFQGARWFAATRSFEDEGLRWNVAAVAPESDFMSGVDESTRVALIVSGGVVVLAVLIAAVMANWVTVPLVLIAREMEKVGRLVLDDTTPPRTLFVEVAVIHDALVTMKTGLRQKRVLEKYVPKGARVDIERNREGRIALGGARVRRTILFSDLRGFTTMSERLAPDQVVALLNAYLEAMTSVIHEHGGDVNEYIGDAILAVFPDPTAAVGAALAMQAALAALRQASAQDEEMRGLRMGIGIATGEVVEGNIGTVERVKFGVVGDTVNVAARIQDRSRDGKHTCVLVSETVRDETATRYEFELLGELMLKGKTVPSRVFEVRADAC